MQKVWMVLRHEIYSLTNRFSFWFGAIGLPLIGFLIFTGVSLVNRSQGGDQTTSPFEGVGQVFEAPEETRPQGFVDLGGLIQHFPEDFDPQQLIPFEREADARAALNNGQISAYYRIDPDYVQTGQVTVYTPEFNLTQTGDRSAPLERLLTFNVLQGDEQLYRMQRQAITDVERVNLSPEISGPQREEDNALTFFLPYAVMMFFYTAILGSAGLLLNSVSKEKENRILEVLLVSTNATDLLMGKIIGLGLIGLLQMLIWASSALLLLRMSGQTFNLSEAYQLSPVLIAWGAVFFVLGYLVYAALMAGVGALVPNMREASQATFIVIFPLIIPLFLLNALIESPNSGLSTAFSLFPLTAPTTMMLRMAATNVPIWQILLSIALLLLTAYLVIRAVAGMFRAQTLLSGQPFKIGRFFKALAGRA